MMIDAREAEILERLRAHDLGQLIPRGADIHLAARDQFEKNLELFV